MSDPTVPRPSRERHPWIGGPDEAFHQHERMCDELDSNQTEIARLTTELDEVEARLRSVSNSYRAEFAKVSELSQQVWEQARERDRLRVEVDRLADLAIVGAAVSSLNEGEQIKLLRALMRGWATARCWEWIKAHADGAPVGGEPQLGPSYYEQSIELDMDDDVSKLRVVKMVPAPPEAEFIDDDPEGEPQHD